MNIDEFFRDGHRLPRPLTKDELHQLFKELNEGSQEARNKLIIHNIRLVLYEVTHKFKNVDYDKKDLVSMGNLGLIKAIHTYDISKGFSFSAYATRCIDNEILIFLKKLKKDQNVDSLNKTVFLDKDGRELELEDQLSDNSDFVEDYIVSETHEIIRELVAQLPDRDKEIVMLYYGFYDDRVYTQQQIADKFHISKSFVSRLITKNTEKLSKQLEAIGVIELHGKQKEKVTEEAKMRRLQSIYEYFNNYTREQVDEMLSKLTEEEKALITLRYGEDLDHPVQSRLTQIDTGKFYGVLIPRMKRLLVKLYDKPKQEVENELCSKMKSKEEIDEITHNMTRDDCTKMLEWLRTPTFTQMTSLLTVKESVIIALKLGYVDGKYFSTESISQFLGIEETEVTETTKKVLLLYKENINSFLDRAIEVATDQHHKDNVLSKEPINSKHRKV